MNIAHLSEAEQRILFNLVFPEDITVNFNDIGGLVNEKQGLKEIVVFPFLYPKLFGADNEDGKAASALLSPPKGVLLYGPPGTGKTMLAKALAKESLANFIAISPSTLLSKYLGETEGYVHAVFTLAKRVAPTIIFIDEIDSMFSTRSSNEHEVHKNLKAEFMQLWDGLLTNDSNRDNHVIILGATNRPYDLDPAIARRMPRSFQVDLPSYTERIMILQKILEGESVDLSFNYREIAECSEGYSGSDLKELCRMAMLVPVKEAIKNRNRSSGETPKVRPLLTGDVKMALREGARTEEKSRLYRDQVESNNAGDNIIPLMAELMRRAT